MDLVLLFRTQLFWNRNFQLGPIGSLDSQKGVTLKALANVVMCNVACPFVCTIFSNVFDALLDPLQNYKVKSFAASFGKPDKFELPICVCQ